MNFRRMNAPDLGLGFPEAAGSADRPGPVNLATFRDRLTLGGITYVLEEGAPGGPLVAATASLILDPKYHKGGARAGLVEDVRVLPSRRGRGLGKRVMEGVLAEAVTQGCYKLVLCCKEEVVPFYEACGYRRSGEVQMRLDLGGARP